MAELSLPFPQVGEVHNYEYLFHADAQAGADESRKARPVLVIVAAAPRVVVLPITTKGEVDGSRTIAIPAGVARAMGLPRPDESALLVDEANIFDWVGHDIRPAPNGQGSRFGRAPPGFVDAARKRFLGAGPAVTPRS